MIKKKMKGLFPFWLALLLCITARTQNISVEGRVTSVDKPDGVAGVSVIVKNTKYGTVTNDKGWFKLDNVSSTASLLFSSVGFKSQTVSVGGHSAIDVIIEAEATTLDQVVVIGYGTAKKKDLTGAVASINAARLENERPAAVQDLLRGNVPGLNIGYSTTPKGDASLEVRGKNTLNAGSSPLIVLDGIIYYGALSDINPGDIESVDILKDASSAAVYGAKAASGVIQITTKKGKTGRSVINLNSSAGYATMSVNESVYNDQDFLNVWRKNVKYSTNLKAKPYQYDDPRSLPSNISVADWLVYDNSNPNADPVTTWLLRLNLQPVEIENYKKGQSINWYDMMFQKGFRQDHNVSISGKKDGLSYYWSLGYMDNKGIIAGEDYNVARTRINLDAKVTKFLTVGMNTQFSVRDESSVPVDWTLIQPNSPWGSFYKDDSSDLRFIPNDEVSGGRNPFGVPKYTDQLKKYYSLNASLYAKIILPFGIKFQTNFTPRFEWFNFYQAQSSQWQDWALVGGIASRQNRQVYQWQVDNLLTWSRDLNTNHHVDVTLLANAEKYQVWRSFMSNSGFSPSDVLGYNNLAAGNAPAIGSVGDYNDETGTLGDEYSTGNALMGRLFYSFKQRYMFTLTTRRDGYSAFGVNHPYATFPSAALGWIFSDEPFFKNKWLSYGKLRISYGKNGNRDIGRYSALSYLTTGKYLHVLTNGTVQQVGLLNVNSMPNPFLKWEQTTSLNLGMDFGFLDGKIEGSIDVYKGHTTGLLVKRSLPDITGFVDVWSNLGQVNNKGLEISLNTRNFERPNFSWNTSIVFSLNRNKIAKLYGNMVDIKDNAGNVIGQREGDDVTNKWFIGQPIDAIWDQRALGIWQVADSATAKKYGVYPGDFHIEDVNNDGKYTNDDRQFLGYTEPRYRWTLRNEFTFYKNFSASFMIYSYGGHMAAYNQAKNRAASFPDRVNSYVFPFWKPDNPINDYARLASSDGAATYSVYKSRTFVRVDNISVGYNVPKSIVKKINGENLKFYFTVRNAAVFSKWDYWDPEWASGSNPGPTPRLYTFGFSLTL